MSGGRGSSASRPWLRAWLVVGIAAWTTLGVLLVTRADNLGLVDDITISPYHLVGYAALATLGVFVAWSALRSLRRGGWRDAFPKGYGGLGLAFVLLVAWVVLDPVWRDSLGVNGAGIENGLAPTRLLIPLALALLASGPVREALARRGDGGPSGRGTPLRWAGVAATGIVGSALTLVAFNPIQSPVSDWAYRPAIDNSEVWSMAADGSGQTRLLAALGDGIDYSLPAWSPDGQRIAYTTWTNDGGAAQNVRTQDQSVTIWTMAPDGSDRRLLVDAGDDAAWIPAWSPDGQWIAYTRSPAAAGTGASTPAEPQPNAAPGQVGPPTPVRGSSIWIVGVDGTGGRQVSPEGLDAVGATWSPDGTQLAFVGAASGTAQNIHVGTLTDAGLSDVRIVGAERGEDWGPAWSPDGTQIAFVSDRTGEPEIWSMATDGSDLVNLTRHPQHFDGTWSLSWSPDGTRLAYGTGSFQDPVTSSWVREDVAVAQALLFAIALAGLASVIVALGAPLGAFAVVLTIVALASAIPVDGWRFVPGALLAGLLVDGLVSVARPRWRGRVAAAGLASGGNLALALTIGLAGSLSWSVTLLLGVGLASALIGWGLATLVERLPRDRASGADATA